MNAAASPRSLAPGAALGAAAQVALTAGGAVATIAVARILGPEGVGAYAIAAAFLLFLTTAGTLGLESGITVRVAAGLWPARRAWAETQLVALALGLLGAAAGVGVALAAPSAFRGLSLALVFLVALALPFALSWIYAAAVAVASDRYEDYALPTLAQALAVALGGVALTLLFGLEGAVASLVLAHVAAAVALAVRTRRALARSAPAPRARGNLTAGARFGLRTYAANALHFVSFRLDLFVLNAVAAGAVVGRYSVAVAVTTLVWILPRALSGVLVPRVAALASASRESRDAVEAKSVRHAVLLVAGAALVLTGGLALVPLVYGPAFAGAIVLGLILLPGSALLGVANVLNATVVGRGRPGLPLLGALLSTPVSALLYLLLIPPYGAVAAAGASTASYTLSFVLACVFYRRVTGARLLPRLLPTRDELADYRRLWRASPPRPAGGRPDAAAAARGGARR